MAQEHKITQISQQAPREYYNEKYKSTTYYIKVKLDGHNKPVEIGKKRPDALNVGDMVFGSIEPTEYETDRFKAVSNFGGGAADLTKLEQKLDAIHGDVKLALSFIRQQQKAETQPEFPLDNVVEDIGDEPMNLDDIPF